METILLTCLQAHVMLGKMKSHFALTLQQKTDIALEVKQITKQGCFQDAKAD